MKKPSGPYYFDIRRYTVLALPGNSVNCLRKKSTPFEKSNNLKDKIFYPLKSVLAFEYWM